MVANFSNVDYGVYRLGPAVFRLAADILSTRSFPKLIRDIWSSIAVDLVRRFRVLRQGFEIWALFGNGSDNLRTDRRVRLRFQP